ncbi:MAG: class I SAM-dependent methyltransferase [Rhodopseudomonas palustris]|nr:class I SAM-dependent methyltransferase [Rhodopseudomonas palustris]
MGIDLDPRMIDVARRTYPAPTFRCMNVLDVGALSGPFDFVFCIGNVAPHSTQDEFARFVGDVANILRPGGGVDLPGRQLGLRLDERRLPVSAPAAGSGDAVFLREYREVSESRVRFVTRLVAGERTVFEGDVWLYPLRTAAYLQLHEEQGFDLLDHVADFQGLVAATTSDTGSVFVFRSRRGTDGLTPGARKGRGCA